MALCSNRTHLVQENDIILCDGMCNRAYHFKCLVRGVTDAAALAAAAAACWIVGGGGERQQPCHVTCMVRSLAVLHCRSDSFGAAHCYAAIHCMP